MNVFLWLLQIILALHTVTGAIWKFSNSEQTVPSLSALPHGVWLGLSVFELVCSLGLILPIFNRRLGVLAPVAAVAIAAEMALFSVVHLRSGLASQGQMVYWLVVAALSGFVAYGRFVLRPLDLR